MVDVSDGISIGLAWPPKMTTICPLGPSAVSPIMALRSYFREEVDAHVRAGGCPLKSGGANPEAARPLHDLSADTAGRSADPDSPEGTRV